MWIVMTMMIRSTMVQRIVQRRVVGTSYRKNNVAPDGYYWIDPDGNGSFEVLCDMTTDDGGWTLISSYTAQDEVVNWAGSTVYNWINESTFGTLEPTM